MSIQWPESLPQYPLLEGYTEEPFDNRLVTNVDAGLDKRRRRFVARPIEVSESYVMNAEQYNTFEAWYRTTIQDGSLTFIKPYPYDPTMTQSREYRFVGQPSVSTNGLLRMVSFNLEIMP